MPPSIDTIRVRGTIIILDTIVVGDTVFTEQLSAAHLWRFQELRAVNGSVAVYHFRGGGSNTFNYDNEYVVFSDDHTRCECDAAGYLHNIPNWH